MRFFDKKSPEAGVQNFEVRPELEALIAEHAQLRLTGTAISLDRDSLSPEQIQTFYDRMTDITQTHGEELMEYLQPYANLSQSDKKRLDSAGFARLNMLGSLTREIEYYKARAENNDSDTQD